MSRGLFVQTAAAFWAKRQLNIEDDGRCCTDYAEIGYSGADY